MSSPSIVSASHLSPGWIVIIVLLVFWLLIVLLRKRKHMKHSLSLVFLRVLIPQIEDKKEQDKEQTGEKRDFKEIVAVMEQLYAGQPGDASMNSLNIL